MKVNPTPRHPDPTPHHIFVNYELGHIFSDFVMKNIIYICVDLVDLNVQLFRRCEGLVFDDLPVRSTSSAPAFVGEHK